ncbi:enoyl-CoA hydratase-related protein [Neptunomonas sp. XY-337]|uniref:enoyl-CoA hydratase-related protein n=1 Tax=Neptunomonas sp. XY-337 TaxID=2561897 RepID=UPI0010AB2956|nr:enoyl-CoA hydratase-related protein [Neptunomonas sp. XY-337]
MTTEQPVLLESLGEGVVLLTLSRPKALNALDMGLLTALDQAITEISAQEDTRAILMTGAGDKAFVAGADIRAMSQMSAVEAEAFARKGQQVFRRLEDLPIPVIALVNGFALGGGCELALSCDFILAAENAVFGQPEVCLGVTAGFGGSQRLPRQIGPGMAMELLLTGRNVKAEEAKQIGLANHIYPQDQLRDEGIKLAQKIVACGPNAVRLTKQLVMRGMSLDLENACVLESQGFGLCFSTDEQTEGMQAFLEKRPAKFN